jgi:hypothetical protein
MVVLSQLSRLSYEGQGYLSIPFEEFWLIEIIFLEVIPMHVKGHRIVSSTNPRHPNIQYTSTESALLKSKESLGKSASY